MPHVLTVHLHGAVLEAAAVFIVKKLQKYYSSSSIAVTANCSLILAVYMKSPLQETVSHCGSLLT